MSSDFDFQEDASGSVRLGSLAQTARLKKLNTAKWILIAIGILTILVNGGCLVMARELVNEGLQKELRQIQQQGLVVDQAKVKQAEETLIRINSIIWAMGIALGATFLVCGLIIKQFPVPVTILSLVLYIGSWIVFTFISMWNLDGSMNVENFLKTAFGGIIWKILIISALSKAIQSAIAYQKAEATAKELEYGEA